MPYVHGWHIDEICRHLEAITFDRFLAMGLDNRLLINVPPGAMKSLIVSVFWPAWEWGPAGFPWLRYLSTSHSENFSTRDCRKMRDLVASEWYQERWSVPLTRKGETAISNSLGGSREAMPFASLTGGRGDRVIIDDPHTTETAESDLDRARTVRIFRESVTERLNDKVRSAIVVIMQRLHEGDVAGTILELGLPYQHIMFPMEFEPERACRTVIGGDPRTQDGELLWPERWSRTVVERDQKPMGAYAIASQYQQRPAPRGGLLFKRSWFLPVGAAAPGTRWCRGWDLAASTRPDSPYTAGLLLGREPSGRFVIANVVRQRTDPHAQERLILATAAQDRSAYGPGVTQDLPQDPGQAGKVQATRLVGLLAGYLVRTSPEPGDKVQRADPVAAQAEGGNIVYIEGPWVEGFFAELTAFPTGKFKDQTDALSRAFAHFVTVSGIKPISPIVVTETRRFAGDHPG